MNIKTKEFNISEAEFSQITKILYYRSKKTMLIGFAIITAIVMLIAVLSPELSPLAIYFVFLLGWFLAIPFIINSAKAQNKIHFQNRTCDLTDNYFITTYEDGSLKKVHFNNYIKVTRESNWYFLDFTKTNFEYLPIRAFNSEDDINEFEIVMKNKKLMTRSL